MVYVPFAEIRAGNIGATKKCQKRVECWLAVLFTINSEDVFADQRPHRHVRVALVQFVHAMQVFELDHASTLHYFSTLCVPEETVWKSGQSMDGWGNRLKATFVLHEHALMFYRATIAANVHHYRLTV